MAAPGVRCPSSAFIIDIRALNGEANSDVATLAMVTSMVYHGRSRLYTLVTVAMEIYHTSTLQALGMINPVATYTSAYNQYVMLVTLLV